MARDREPRVDGRASLNQVEVLGARAAEVHDSRIACREEAAAARDRATGTGRDEEVVAGTDRSVERTHVAGCSVEDHQVVVEKDGFGREFSPVDHGDRRRVGVRMVDEGVVLPADVGERRLVHLQQHRPGAVDADVVVELGVGEIAETRNLEEATVVVGEVVVDLEAGDDPALTDGNLGGATIVAHLPRLLIGLPGGFRLAVDELVVCDFVVRAVDEDPLGAPHGVGVHRVVDVVLNHLVEIVNDVALNQAAVAEEHDPDPAVGDLTVEELAASPELDADAHASAARRHRVRCSVRALHVEPVDDDAPLVRIDDGRIGDELGER